ncbi:MAG: rod shape-determining protein MreC [Tannerella sp.]|jgi:rod shape-determining protein MreC|nr:rod shape-determining protein MreC [Tannerella sp.]
MQKLIEFLIGKRHWLLFILCEVISFTLLYRYNPYQQNVMLSSTNMVTGNIMSVSNSVFSYLNLRNENRILIEQNKQLELDILHLKLQLESVKTELMPYNPVMTDSMYSTYDYITAEVVNNSITGLLNYITVKKGTKEGIRPEMGVISAHGVVGKVYKVNDHFTVIIPLLNPKWKLSCKILNSNYSGLLVWNGRNTQYANLEELPTHTEFQVGDTVVTSGFSGVFPPGIIVGTIVDSDNSKTTGLYSLKVKLATDFSRLKTVRIVKNKYQNQQWEVEQEAGNNE